MINLKNLIILSVLSAGCSAASGQNEITIENNSAPVISNNKIGRDLNLSYIQSWDLNRQALVSPLSELSKNNLLNNDLLNTEIFIDQLRKDKDFLSFLIIFTGISGRINLPEAQKLLESSAEKGSASAAFFLGVISSNGYWKPADENEAKRLFTLAAERGSAGAQRVLSVNYWQGSAVYPKDLKKSTYYLKLLIENEGAERDARAISSFNLANRYISGEGADKNFCLGIKTHAVAANLGNAISMRNLGYERENYDRCFPKDKKVALSWFEKGASLGDEFSAAEAGRMNQFGIAGSRNYIEAEKFYLEAKTPYANRQLGWIYAKGLHSNELISDYSKSLTFFRRAVDQGDAEAMISVGLLYEYGLGVPQNAAEAFRWYGKGADAGAVRGRINQAVSIMENCVEAENLPNWAEDLRKISETTLKDNDVASVAMFHLGHAYLHGKGGISKDARQATNLFEKSCKNGYGNSCSMLVLIKGEKNVSSSTNKLSQKHIQSDWVSSGTSCKKNLVSKSVDPDQLP